MSDHWHFKHTKAQTEPRWPNINLWSMAASLTFSFQIAGIRLQPMLVSSRVVDRPTEAEGWYRLGRANGKLTGLVLSSSSSSSFEVQTFDPEGVLLFGDSRGGHDWFLLGLRAGRPEIHIHNQMAKVSVSGGPKINDGKWHKVAVRSQEHRIVLEVDGQEALRIGHVSEGVTSSLDTTMRIAVGGILTNSSELMEPLHIPLDACLRHWVFLGVTPKWLLDPTFLPHPKRCFASQRSGSYFPGSGHVAYRTSDLPAALSQTGGPWALSLQMDLFSESHVFPLLRVSHPETGTLLFLRGQDRVRVGHRHTLGSNRCGMR
eukprot:XP_004919884.1 PREDICTED: sex hormone-binding globulin-like [Xenopus tropicalis]